MKAVVYTNYGAPDVLKYKEVIKPIPRDNEVLIKVSTATVTTADCLMRKAETLMSRVILGLRKPKKRYQIMGIELAGIIEAIGRNVKKFKIDDEVYGFAGFSAGAYAQYKCLPENASIVIKPKNISFDESASIVDGATTALFFLKYKGNIKRGEKILIIGASGSIGTAAVQLAKYFETEVTGVCSEANSDLVKSLGADKVIDYTKEDFTENGESYDMIFDTVAKNSFLKCKKSLKKHGRYIVTTGNFIKINLLHLWTAMLGGKRIITGMSINKKKELVFINELIKTETLKPVIDKYYSLDEIPQAHDYVEKGHKKGNVVIQVREKPA